MTKDGTWIKEKYAGLPNQLGIGIPIGVFDSEDEAYKLLSLLDQFGFIKELTENYINILKGD